MSGQRRLMRLIVAAFVMLSVAVSGCASQSNAPPTAGNVGVVQNEDKPQPGGKIVYGLVAETNGWNPSASQWAPSGHQVVKAIFDTLSGYDDQSKIHPNLAAGFEHNAEYTQWKIKLRPGIKLHNGKAVTAAVVKANQDFLKTSPLTGSAYEMIESFATEGDLTIVVNLKQKFVNYPYALATQIGVVSDPDWLKSGDSRTPIGTGPFRFESWETGRQLIVKKNLDYWRAGLPYLDEIEFRPLPDDDTRSASLERGDIDIMEATNGALIVNFKNKAETGAFQVFNAISGESSEVFVQLNGMNPPFDDIDARRALAYATDKTAYIEVVAAGLFEPANGPFVPSSRWYNSDVETIYPQYDPVKARELVEKVKAKNGGTFTFNYIGAPTPGTQRGMQVLREQWNAVGIEASINNIEQAQLIVGVLTGNYQAVQWQQFDSPHPLGDSIWWHPNTANPIPDFSLNFARNKDPKIGEALDDARQTEDPNKELEDYRIVQARLAEDVPYIWLYHSQISIIASNKLVNVVNYKLPPDGSGVEHKGLEIQGGAHSVSQIWKKP